MTSASTLEAISTRQARIAELAKQMPDRALYSVAHHMDVDWLREAYRRTRKDGAVGVDRQTAEQYAENLEENLQRLLDRVKSKTYRAPPVRRVRIPKGKGETRPIGIPTFEDKVLQRAVVMLLEPVFEQDFYDGSYGFRPGRSAHDALAAVNDSLWNMRGGWVLDVDIQSFFDSLDHGKLREMLRQRVVDGVVVRLIGKWLKAGVLEDGAEWRPEAGSPQGGVVSPLLANIYLHEVIDDWWVKDVQPRMGGRAELVRYADDFVMIFSERQDAERVQAVLPGRLARYGLTLNPEKTRLVRFQYPGPGGRYEDAGQKPGSFDFLGFTHFWGKTRKGNWAPKRKTSKKSFSRSCAAIKRYVRNARHQPVSEQASMLSRKLQGHYNYYGLRGNWAALARFWYEVKRLWRKWLGRRSQRARLTWETFNRLLARYPLPRPRLRSGWRQSRLANL